jgi:hypothetical protein
MSISVVLPGRLSSDGSPSRVHCAPKTRLRLNRRGRLVVAMLAVVPLAGGAFLFALNGGGAFASTEVSASTGNYVVVQPGQSLWCLAEQFAPHRDPRDYIAEVVALNRLSSTSIDAGARLVLPTGDDSH